MRLHKKSNYLFGVFNIKREKINNRATRLLKKKYKKNEPIINSKIHRSIK